CARGFTTVGFDYW
nr:immunoglobulin heavy chain junction region [Mus musculus]